MAWSETGGVGLSEDSLLKSLFDTFTGELSDGSQEIASSEGLYMTE